MSNEKMRAEFEAWVTDYAATAPSGVYPELLMRFEDDPSDYRQSWVHAAWQGWKASREALVIELPDDGIEDCQKERPERGGKYSYDTFDTGYLYACKKHEQAIEAAGVKWK